MLATPGARIQLGSMLSTYAYFQFRVYQHSNGPEVVARRQVLVGTSYALGF